MNIRKFIAPLKWAFSCIPNCGLALNTATIDGVYPIDVQTAMLKVGTAITLSFTTIALIFGCRS